MAEDILVTLRSSDLKLCQGTLAKAGSVVTDNGNLIINALFLSLLILSDLNNSIKGNSKNGI
jgi:ribose 5-phosphate isomerase